MDRNQSFPPPPHPPQFYRTSLQPQQNVAELQQASLMKVSWWVPNASCSCQEICCCWRMLMCNIMSQRLKFSFYQKYRYGTVFFDGQILPLSNKNGRSFPPWSIRYFHLFQNAPCMPPPPPPPKNCISIVFHFFFGEEREVSCLGVRGGELPYEREGDACRLA